MPSLTEPASLPSARSAAPAWPPEPYKGLNFFCASDAPLFSEREEDIEDCAARIDDFATRVLLLHGLSGTGKSSFLRAGLVPRLQEPPDQGCTFFFLRDRAGEPVLIRATDDPIARIHETLAEAARSDERIPQAARTKMQDILKASPHSDRKLTADTLIAALQPLTAGLRDIFVLLVDQAEEVLTLPRRSEDAFNRRVGFFYLLEELCHHRLDMRAIVAFRTEYCGQFCSFFRIPATLSVTSAALPRAGLLDYLLRPIDDPGQIAAMIRRPTLTEPVGLLPAPRRTYGFEYKPGLAEQIARDLVQHSGDASTLPVMQIVCKDLYERVCREEGRSLITGADYEGIGCVEGAVDSHIESAIRGALAEAGAAEPSTTEIERWRMVFADHLVGRQEGGAVTTLIAAEDTLVAAAQDQGIEGDPVPVLRAMAQGRWRVLRPVKRPGGTGQVYSLGHDCLGPPLSRWSEKHGERLRAEEEAERRFEQERRDAAARLARKQWFRMAIAGAVVAVVGAIGLVVLQSTYLPRQQTVTVLNSVAAQQASNHLRERLLLLVSSLEKVKGWPWSWAIGSQAAREQLKEALLRSPVFGGAFPASLNGEGDRLAYFDYGETRGRLLIVNLETGQPVGEPLQPATSGLVDPRSLRPPAAGFVAVDGSSEPRREAVAVGGSRSEYLLALSGAAGLQQVVAPVPDQFVANATFPPQPDFAGGTLRLVSWSIRHGLIETLNVLPLKAVADGSAIRIKAGEPYGIDWQSERRNARRLPALADDCAAYGFVGREDDIRDYQPILWTGLAGSPAEPRTIGIRLPQGDQALSSVGFARGCGAIFVRTPGRLAAFDLTDERIPLQAEERVFALPEGLGGFMLSSFPQAPPPLAVAPRQGSGWRAAWVVDSGLAVAELRPGKTEAEALLTDAGQNAQPFLTGLDSAANISRLTMSRSGEFLLVSQQRSFATKPDIRVFDLRLHRRRRALDTADLRREACRVAGFLPGGNQLKTDELVAWLGDEKSKQPCSD